MENENALPDSFDIGSEIWICGHKFVVTDFANRFDGPATAQLMSVDEIRRAASGLTTGTRLPRYNQFRRPRTNISDVWED